MQKSRLHKPYGPRLPKNPPVRLPRDLSVPEVATALGYCSKYIREELIHTGKLKAYRHGRVWKIPEAALEEYRARKLIETRDALLENPLRTRAEQDLRNNTSDRLKLENLPNSGQFRPKVA